ncbi:MAG: hypothetical protein ACRCT7_01580 [Shewanella sp.]
MMRILAMVILNFTLLTSAYAAAGLLVVMQKNAPVEKLDRHQVVDIFMGRNNMLNTDQKYRVFDQNTVTGIRESFYRQLVNRSETQIDAYWARLLFSGRTAPPTMVKGMDELVQKVVQTPGGIAYISRDKLVDELKVVYEFSAPHQ